MRMNLLPSGPSGPESHLWLAVVRPRSAGRWSARRPGGAREIWRASEKNVPIGPLRRSPRAEVAGGRCGFRRRELAALFAATYFGWVRGVSSRAAPPCLLGEGGRPETRYNSVVFALPSGRRGPSGDEAQLRRHCPAFWEKGAVRRRGGGGVALLAGRQRGVGGGGCTRRRSAARGAGGIGCPPVHDGSTEGCHNLTW